MKLHNELTHHNLKISLKNRMASNRLISLLLNIVLKAMTKNVKSYIFVATTGRSGTTSLSTIFEGCSGVKTFHEPYPVMYTPVDIESFHKTYYRKLFLFKKRIMIRIESIGSIHYLETNHQFIKNFSANAVKEFGEKIRVINLVRDPILVAKSFLEINSIPGMTDRGRAWLIDPLAKENIIKCDYLHLSNNVGEKSFLHCLWYWFETQARVAQFKNEFPKVPILEVKTDDFNNVDSLHKVMTFLNIETNLQQLENVCGKKINKKSREKLEVLQLSRCSELYELFYALLTEKIDSKYIYTFIR
jgi:hypothetical protein